MGTKNVDMRLIKWEGVWNNNRKKKNGEGERVFFTTTSWVTKKSKIVAAINVISLNTHFLRKNENKMN